MSILCDTCMLFSCMPYFIGFDDVSRHKRYTNVPVIPNDETSTSQHPLPRRFSHGTMGSHPKCSTTTATQVNLSSTLTNSRYANHSTSHNNNNHSYDDDDDDYIEEDPEARKPNAYIRERTNADGGTPGVGVFTHCQQSSSSTHPNPPLSPLPPSSICMLLSSLCLFGFLLSLTLHSME